MQKEKQLNTAERNMECPICDQSDIDRDVSECPPICLNCGYVIQKNHDEDISIEDTTDPDSQSSAGKTWAETHQVENATQQRLAEAFERLEAIGDQIDASKDLRLETADSYCKLFKKGLTDGRKASVTIAVSLRIASIRQETPIPIDILINQAGINRSAFNYCYSAVVIELDAEREVPSPADYLPFLETVLELDEKARDDAQRRLDSIMKEASVAGKNPAGFAAAAVYMAADERTQADMGEAVGVSTETIRQRVAQFRDVSMDD